VSLESWDTVFAQVLKPTTGFSLPSRWRMAVRYWLVFEVTAQPNPTRARRGRGKGLGALGVLAVLVLSFLGCTSNETPAPVLHAMEPNTVWNQIQTPSTLQGEHLYRATASVDLSQSQVNTEEGGFEVAMDGNVLAPEDFQWVDSRTLDLVIPANLDLGSHSISVRVQDGRVATLDNAFTVGDQPVPYCGDGSCNGSEEIADCPEDCAVPVCGDGGCNGGEDNASCPEDCGSCATCSTGTCSDACTGVTCNLPRCDDPCTCTYDCTGATSTCGVECRSFCSANCAGADDCNLECRDAAECKFSCADATNCDVLCRHDSVCTVECPGGTCNDIDCHNNAICNIDCTDAVSCDAIQCTDNAQCLVNCAGAGACAFAGCEFGELSCPNDVIVCGRLCP
jgi:hypothetical protein